jgi:hypothetical protein
MVVTMLPGTLPAMSATSFTTIGSLLGPLGTLAFLATFVVFVVLIAGLVMERRDLTLLDPSNPRPSALGDPGESLVEHPTRAA